MKRNLSLLLGLLLMVAFVFEGNAAFHDPAIKWRTIKTEHFKIHYNEDVEFAAKRVAIIAEEVHQSLTKKMEWKPWGKTEVVISDGFDTGNGWGTVVPYNWITLYVGSPLPDSSLAQYDDWLRMLVAHEYTHILHLDMARGIWRALKYMIGKVSAPNALTPGWIKEGEAVYNETRETHSGRIRGTYDQMIIRTAILQNKFPRIDQVDGTGWRWPGYGSMYIYGAQFIDHLADKYGEKKLIEFNKRTAATPLLHSINRQAKKTFGKTFYVLWKDWQKTLEMKYGEEKEKIESTKLTELDVVVQGEEEYYSLPTFSSDGRWLAYVNYSAHHAGYLYLKDLKTNEIKKIGEGRETLEGEDEIPDQEFRKSSKVRGVSQITFSPDGKKIMYSMLGSYKRYYDYFSIYEYDIEKSKTKTVIYGKRGRDPDISPDGKKIVYVRNSPKGNSLWLHELKDKDKGEDEDKEISEKVSFYVIPAEAGIQKLLKRLDPRIREDDRQTVFQRFHKDKNKDESKDKDKKEVAKVDEEKDKMILDDKELFIQYNNPRWSPDGGYIAFSSHRGFQRDLYLFSVKNKKLTRITNDKALDLRPWWNQRSKELYFSSDRTGISNIYKYNLNTKKLVRVTNVLTGVFEPAVTADGKDLYVKYYDGNGYDIRKVKKTISIDAKNDKKFNFSQFDKGLTEKYSQIKITDERLDREVKIVNRKTKKSKKIEKDAPQTVDQSKPAKKEYESKKYSPFGMGMLPRSLVPGFLILDDALMFSALVNGNDPLLHHIWMGGATYRTDAEYLGGFFNYTYNKYRPVFFTGFNAYISDFGTYSYTDANGDLASVHVFERRYRGYGGVSYSFSKLGSLSLSYNYEDRDQTNTPQITVTGQNISGVFAGPTVTYSYGKGELYPASISIENGRRLRTQVAITDKTFGSSSANEQVIFAGDYREYIRLHRHHVLALKVAGGMQWGDLTFPHTFSIGGALGEGAFAGTPSLRYFQLRGLPMPAMTRNRALVGSLEYRLPLMDPQRGLGTWPIFLKDIHFAPFADYGYAWDADEDTGDYFFDNFLLGVGGEIRADFVVFHGVPVHGRLGYGIIVVNRDDPVVSLADPILGGDVKNGILILQFGTAF